MSKTLWRSGWSKRTWKLMAMLLAVAFIGAAFATQATAQDQDDPPGRVARLGFMEGSISFQPAGEDEWVEAVPNRPMTTGDKLWADHDSRAEVQLGSATIDLGPNTGFSFLNLDDRTIQIQLSAGSLNVRVWDLDRDNVFEVDTPNQAFTVRAPGRYRVDASEDGNYTVVTIREGEGESTGNGQSYTMHSGQRFTLSGTTSLNAEVDQIGAPDDFDAWSDRREHRYEDSPSARYCSQRVVGFQDLDDNGDWQQTEYGPMWFPRVEPGWAPYHYGHWAWIDPWGWTWVDDARWGYAPFHYGRWANFHGRWGWIPGPREERPVYAPALVVFAGGGPASGGDVAWFPLGPREVYVPSYHVSEAYVNRVNVTNTTVNTTTVTNVYNTTIVNNNTTVNNVTYVNRNVQGAVTAVPPHAFASAQPVAKAAVPVNARQLSAMPVSTRAAVPPAREAVLGTHANTVGRVAAPPQAIASRPVVAKVAPPPPLPSFAARQKVLAQHPGQPVPRQELQKMQPARAAAVQVKQAPPAKPATPTQAMNRPGNQPGNGRPGGPAPAATPAGPPPRSERPAPAQPNNRPQPNAPAANRPEANRPEAPNRPETPNRPAAAPNPPAGNRPEPTPNRPEVAPNNRPEENHPEMNRPAEPARTGQPPNEPANNRYGEQPNAHPAQPAPPAAHPAQPPQPAARPQNPAPQAHPQPQGQPHPQAGKPAPPAQHPQSAPQEKKKDEKKPQ